MCYLLKTMGNTTHMSMSTPVVFLIPRTEQHKCSPYKRNVNSTSTSDSAFCSDVRADIQAIEEHRCTVSYYFITNHHKQYT